MKKTIVKQVEGSEVPVEVIAQAVLSISQGIKKLRTGPLNDYALVLLIQHACPPVKHKPISQKEVKTVLAGLEALERTYLKKKA